MEIDSSRNMSLNYELIQPGVELLRNQIDYSKAPFSDRGSRMLVFLNPENHRLDIKLAERLIRLDPDIEAYLHRPPLVQDFSFINQDGELIRFNQLTSYPHAIFFSTGSGKFGITFAGEDTLAIGLPPNQICGLNFFVPTKNWIKRLTGGTLQSYRDLSYLANCEIVDNTIVQDKEGCRVNLLMKTGSDSTVILNLVEKPNEDIQQFSYFCNLSKQKWENLFRRIPPVDKELEKTYYYAWWIMANNLVSPHGTVTRESMMPAKGKYVGMWLWDNAMHALAYRHIDAELAQNQIRVMLDNQMPSSMRE